MTDNDIIKALKCCHGQLVTDCENCPNKDTCDEIDVIQQTINIINRQHAEIERLNEENKRLLSMLFRKARGVSKVVKNIIKTEAIKEFAKRLHEEAKSNKWNGTICGVDIDNIVKEMEGENDEC